MKIREKKNYDSNIEVIPSIQGEKVVGIGKTEQRDAMRHSGSVPAVTLSPEAKSGLLQHYSRHCVIMEFSIND